MCTEAFHEGAMLHNGRCQDCGYVCQWPEVTIKGAAIKSVFNEINRTKRKLLEENSCNGHVMTTATGGSINRYLQKLRFTRLYTHVRFDYAYTRQMYHRHYTAGLEYRFGADFDTLKQDLQDERNYNFILIQPTKSAIERGKNQEFWKLNCPKCTSKNKQVLYDNNGEYCWCV